MLEKLNKEFTYKKLTEEEQKARGILGRLVGVIADSTEPTRNGRKYSKDLWEGVFNDPIMQEKIQNRCVLGELGHPTDRSEIDIEKVAICLAETPKLGKDGKLYGVFDILSTPNGKILKALCDYGCKIGVSSRGQGDLETDFEGNESVIPESYECECWDAVLIPAVKSARPAYVTESLNRVNKIKLSSILTESYNKASDEDKKIMKETLKSLDIEINDEPEIQAETEIEAEITPAEVAEKEAEEEIVEIENDETESSEKESEEEIENPKVEVENEIEEKADDDSFIEKFTETFEDWKEKWEEKNNKDFPEISVNDLLDFTQTVIEAFPEETVDEIADDVNKEESKEDEVVVNDIAAEDTGAEELVDNLKEALAARSALEDDIKDLQAKLAVSDTKVEELEEKCSRYEKAVERLSTMAQKGKELEEQVADLQESLQAEQTTNAEQKKRIERLVKAKNMVTKNSAAINESVSLKSNQLNTLNEELKSQKALLEETVKKYEAELKNVTESLEKDKAEVIKNQSILVENLNKEKKLKEGYKNFANKASNKYIEVKAMTLGLSAKDIKRKLGESYTLEDVDQVCESLKEYQLNVNRLPFGINDKVTFKVNESRQAQKLARSTGYDDDDAISDGLIKLANL